MRVAFHTARDALYRVLRYFFGATLLALSCFSLASASLITYDISTQGRIQAGSVVLGNMEVEFRLTVDSADQDAIPNFGAYVGTLPFFVRRDGQLATIIGDTGVAVSNGATEDYVQFSGIGATGFAQFFGRDFGSILFNFIDCCGAPDMLSSDVLPTTAAFAANANSVVNALLLGALPGDPFYAGPSTYTRFTICEVSVQDECVYAPLRIRVVAEPPTLLLATIAALVMIGAGRGKNRVF